MHVSRTQTSDRERDAVAERFHPLRDALGNLLSSDAPPIALAASWALVWMGAARLPSTPPAPAVLLSLYRLWGEAESSDLANQAAIAFSTQPLLPRDTFGRDAWANCDTRLERTATKRAAAAATLVLAWYRRTPRSNSELVEKISETPIYPDIFDPTAREILATLGEPGQRVLAEWGDK